MLYTNTAGAWCDEYFYIFISLYIFPRVNLRVYFRKIFGAEQRLEQNLASQILIWRRMIPKIHLAQRFGEAITVVPIEVLLKYRFNTLPRADQFISSSSSKYSYTS